MTQVNYLLWIALVVIASILYLVTEKISKKISKKIFKIDLVAEVLYDNAKVALEKIISWTTWLTGLQTAAMATMALMIKDKTSALNEVQKNNGFFVLLFFGASVILSTWLLSSTPSIQQRLIKSDTPNETNDIYAMKIFSFIPITLGRFCGLVHTYFLIGIVFFALFIFSLFP